MASEEHKKLADFIKSTHNQLREESRIYGPLEAWERHLARTEVLKNYATTMRLLATEHWREQIIAERNREGAELRCRNEWIRSQCYDYYLSGGRDNCDDRENKIRSRSGNDTRLLVVDESDSRKSKIELLDVGSCYDPLGSEPNLDVTPIDIAPSVDRVYRCDFLRVPLGDAFTITVQPEKTVVQLKVSSYDVVLFSLLLEYLPCPQQRYECCAKASALLRPGGLLLVVTPDSSHAGANAKLMKSWRYVLCRLGFVRITSKKLQHLRCLAFRKCATKEIAIAWSRMKKFKEQHEFLISENKIYIPQDLRRVESDKEGEIIEYDCDQLARDFEQMPCSSDIFE